MPRTAVIGSMPVLARVKKQIQWLPGGVRNAILSILTLLYILLS